MPTKAPRACGHCGGVHQSGERCPVVATRDAERKARFDKKRPSARQRGYDADWERESKIFLAVYSSCVRCGGKATLVHHSAPHKGDMTIFWDRSKWRPFCKPCHDGPAQSAERRNLKEGTLT